MLNCEQLYSPIFSFRERKERLEELGIEICFRTYQYFYVRLEDLINVKDVIFPDTPNVTLSGFALTLQQVKELRPLIIYAGSEMTEILK